MSGPQVIPHEPTNEEVRLWLSRCPYPNANPSGSFQAVSDYDGSNATNQAEMRRAIVVAAIRAGHEPWGLTGGTA